MRRKRQESKECEPTMNYNLFALLSIHYSSRGSSPPCMPCHEISVINSHAWACRSFKHGGRGEDKRMESKNLGAESKTVIVEETAEKKKELEEKEADESVECHHHSSDSNSNSKSGSESGSDSSSKSGSRLLKDGKEKSKEKIYRKKHKKKGFKGKLTVKASKTGDEGALAITDEDKLGCKSDSSSSSSSKSSSKSSSSSKSVSSKSVSSKSSSDSKSDSDSGGGKKKKKKKKGLKQKKTESSTEENKVSEKGKLTEAGQEIEAKGADKTDDAATSKEEIKHELLPVSKNNKVEEITEAATEGN